LITRNKAKRNEISISKTCQQGKVRNRLHNRKCITWFKDEEGGDI